MNDQSIIPAKRDGRKYFVNGERITIENAKKKCRKILQKRGVLTGENLIFVSSILMGYKPNYQHPIKIKSGISSDGYWNCFYFVNTDGEWEDFSFHHAMKTQKQKSRDCVIEAFRHEISHQVMEFRCSKGVLGNKNYHADHIIPFHVLISDFLRDEGLKWEQIETLEVENPIHHRDCLRDRELAERWRLYHEHNAKLQVLEANDNYNKRNTFDMTLWRYRKTRGEVV